MARLDGRGDPRCHSPAAFGGDHLARRHALVPRHRQGLAGRSEADPDGLATALLEWIDRARFDRAMVDRRVSYWRTAAVQARDQAYLELDAARPNGAAVALQMAAEALIEAFTERWGGRSGSLSRSSTRFERFAAQVGQSEVAEAVMEIAGRRTVDIEGRLKLAPGWLRDRTTLAYEAR
jgi:hypothetical protein